MQIINSPKFDGLCNQAVNEAIRLAIRLRCGEISCSHLLLAFMLKNEKYQTEFFDATGKTYKEFASALEKECESGKFGSIENMKNNTLEIDNMSKQMSDLLGNAIKNNKNNGPTQADNLFWMLLQGSETEVKGTLAILGVDITKIKTHTIKDPLSDMKVTSHFGMDMNIHAKQGGYDPIEGRDEEIDTIIEILGRRQKSNPCLIGEPGVGKTAIIEGLAQRINEGSVPEYMKDCHIISIDISGIISGARFRGDFEERLNSILYEADAHKNVILFFDEIHMLMGSGGNDGGMSAANILKPAISRGNIRIIGATTTKEYTKFVESDGAFDRRMQSVLIEEPSCKVAIKMLRKLKKTYSNFHKCDIPDDVLEAAVYMSDRYITDRKLPDKAISVIDETAARIKAELNGIDGFTITKDDIRKTISKITNIDIQEINGESKTKLQGLEESLGNKVIGQRKAIEVVSKAIRRSKAGIKDPNRPMGSFLFVGPTGVGKTELTKALAIEFSGDIKNLIRFDMSEFMEKHTVARMIGSPPGYVGYGEGGQLTEAVRHNPNSVILFDEIEKAHPDVFNILLQVLDDGILTDSRGVKVDFKNTLIIMTSNAGYGNTEHKQNLIGFGAVNDTETDEQIEEKALKALESVFRPEFLNRLDKVVVFNKLSKEECYDITKLELAKITNRLKEKDITVTWDDSMIKYITEVGYSEKYGARNIKRKVQEVVEDTLADKIINDEIIKDSNICISYNKDSKDTGNTGNSGNSGIIISETVSLDKKLMAFNITR